MTNQNHTNDSDAELPAITLSAAQQAGGLLDQTDSMVEETSLTPDGRRNLADQLWLSSLLAQVLRPAEASHREQLIQRVMNSIQVDAVPTVLKANAVPSMPRRSWLATAASLVALLLVGLYLFGPQAGPKTALAAVEHSLQAAAEDVDRQYVIETARADNSTRPPILLTVRGAKQFVWERAVPHGKILVGSNGKEFWMVPVLGPVLVASEGSELEQMLSQGQGSMPILNVSSALEWMRDRYDLELLPNEDVPESETSAASISCVHYRGRLRVRSDWFLPETMEIWSHRETGVVQRAVMTWPALLPSGVRSAELRLKLPPEVLPADWYDHTAHHDARRMVLTPPKGIFPAADGEDAPAP